MDKRAFLKAFLKGVSYHVAKLRIFDAQGGRLEYDIQKEVREAAAQRGICSYVEHTQKEPKGKGIKLIHERETDGNKDINLYFCGTRDDYLKCLQYEEQKNKEKMGAHL